MSRPVDTLLDRLAAHKLRSNGNDRWRAVCPVCGETNANTLAIGVGSADQVLLKCFKGGCGPEEITAALGLDLTDLFPARESFSAPQRRRRLLPAYQALALLESEANIVSVAAANLANGCALTSADLDRLRVASARVAELREECLA